MVMYMSKRKREGITASKNHHFPSRLLHVTRGVRDESKFKKGEIMGFFSQGGINNGKKEGGAFLRVCVAQI